MNNEARRLDIRVSPAAPIGHPLPIMQRVTTTEDVAAFVANYGSAWGMPVPPADQWIIEEIVLFNGNIVARAAVRDQNTDDVLLVYDTLFRAQIWRTTRQNAEREWPRLLAHAKRNAPK